MLTRASHGIGHATVKYSNAVGWRVFTASRQSWASECLQAGDEENYIHLDPEDILGAEASLELIREKLGDDRLHALVDNVGISPKGEGGECLGVPGTDYVTWLRAFNVSLFPIALLVRGLLTELEAAQGMVINVTSIAGLKVRPFVGVTHATSKATLSALTREMAHDLGPHGVQVNVIAPEEADTSIPSPGTEETVERSVPLHRLGQPEEIISLTYLLCTSGVSYVNDAEIHVNGGQHA